MPDARTVEDRLREEYFQLLPEVRRATVESETRVRAALLTTTLAVERHERVLITSRIKECESAVDALRRRQPLGLFDQNRPEDYSLRALRDLAAVRVMAFPHHRLAVAHAALQPALRNWHSDPVPNPDASQRPLAFKYYGTWTPDASITSEIQIVPLLIGLFWEVEHSAIYKPSPNLHGVVLTETVLQKRDAVLAALDAFESAFESAIQHSDAASD